MARFVISARAIQSAGAKTLTLALLYVALSQTTKKSTESRM